MKTIRTKPDNQNHIDKQHDLKFWTTKLKVAATPDLLKFKNEVLYKLWWCTIYPNNVDFFIPI